MENNESVERYFFKYAFPCSQVLLQLKKISQEEYTDLRKKFLKKEFPSRETLERVFSAAFTRIKKLAEKMQKDYWNPAVIKEYWENYHNQIITEGDGMYGKAPESFKDLCRINIAKVIERKGNMLIVNIDGNRRIVFDVLVPDISIGDKVKVHYGYAVEKIT